MFSSTAINSPFVGVLGVLCLVYLLVSHSSSLKENTPNLSKLILYIWEYEQLRKVRWYSQGEVFSVFASAVPFLSFLAWHTYIAFFYLWVCVFTTYQTNSMFTSIQASKLLWISDHIEWNACISSYYSTFSKVNQHLQGSRSTFKQFSNLTGS